MTDVFFYKKRRFGHRHVQRKDYVRTQQEDVYLQAKERNLRRNQRYLHLDRVIPTSRTMKK